MTDKFLRLAALKPARPLPKRSETPLRAPDDFDLVGRVIGAGIARNPYGEHLAIRNWFSSPEFCAPSEGTIELLSRATVPASRRRKTAAYDAGLTRRNRAALENPEKWLFLDTETTGLAGGTGTYAFLVGLAWWDAGGLQVEQLFLRDFSEEHSLLHELATRFEERPVLVTFNGKSFDWPLLENRFTMTRAIRPPKLMGHLDLLYPARALWKLRLGSVRLVDLERHVLDAARLGWHREDDISSVLIPQYYFDFLRGGRPDPLVGVVRHNQMDLRGLAALFGKINAMLEEGGVPTDQTESLDLFGLSRFLNRRGERERAHFLCTKALDAGLPAAYRPQATRELALLAKRRGDHTSAALLWETLSGDPQDGLTACEQLAIHYATRQHDLARALEFAQLGLAKATRYRKLTRDPMAAARLARLEQRFGLRVQRLEQRSRKKAEANPLLRQMIRGEHRD